MRLAKLQELLFNIFALLQYSASPLMRRRTRSRKREAACFGSPESVLTDYIKVSERLPSFIIRTRIPTTSVRKSRPRRPSPRLTSVLAEGSTKRFAVLQAAYEVRTSP